MSTSDPAELDGELELAAGRRAPYTQLGDWLLLSGAECETCTLYWALSIHINTGRVDNEVWPSLQSLARMVGLKKTDNVARFMLQLEVLGAAEVIRSTKGLVRRNRYVVHQTPPSTHQGPFSLADWYAVTRYDEGWTKEQQAEHDARVDEWLGEVRSALRDHCEKVAKERAAARKAKEPVPPVELFVAPPMPARTPAPGGTARPAETDDQNDNETNSAGQHVPPRQGVRTPAPGGSAPPRQGGKRDEAQPDETQQENEAPSARSAPHAGGSTSGSREPGSSGDAAANGAKAPKGSSVTPRTGRKPRMSQQTARAVRQVEAAWPKELRTLLPNYRPNPLRDALVEALDSRTPQQLAERIQRRWYAHGYARDAADDGRGIERPVGVAVALVRPSTDCPDPMCEDGITLDRETACRSCEERRTDRKAALPRQAGPGQPRSDLWECEVPTCRKVVNGSRPDDGLCPACHEEMVDAIAYNAASA
ncbi:hypothetical protein ACWGIR_22965 [Streptomyces albidoflavus]